MKKLILLLFALACLLSFTGCEEAVENPSVSEAEVNQRALDRLRKNEGISYEMFEILTERLPVDSLKALRDNAYNKESFINVVARQTDDYFNEVVEAGVSEFNINTVPTPFSGEAEITLRGLVSTVDAPGAAPFDLVGAYGNLIKKQIEEQAAADGDDHRQWIVVDYFQSSESAAGDRPAETLSLNFAKMKFLVTIPTIIMDLSLTDEQVLTEISDVLNANEIPPVAAALLVPAVQKIREAAHSSNDQPFEDSMKEWLDGPISQAINGGLNRDIIRRIQATVYLAALHTIILEEYEGTNEDMASLSVLHARYRAALLMGTKELWVE